MFYSAICSCNMGSEEEIEAQIRACGEHTAIRWIKGPVYRNAVDAADKVRLLQRNDKESVAVRYYDQQKINRDRELCEHEEAYATYKAADEAMKLDSDNLESVSCPNCKSIVAKKYLKGHICPVCKQDMRSLDFLEKLNALKHEADACAAKVSERNAALRKTTENIRWMFLIVYKN